jgi:hypothetical protein
MQQSPFPYSYWSKILGLIIMILGIVSFFLQHSRKGIYDFNELAMGFSWGLVFVFFSREKTDDEMMQGLKFRALTRAIIIAFFITHLYNYLFLNWRLAREHDIILSISAYQYLALTLIIATAGFYYLKYQVTSNNQA